MGLLGAALSVLGLALAAAGWALVQRWAGYSGEDRAEANGCGHCDSSCRGE
ncbi:MAG: hypothetical protein JXQ29_14380 [Planctomycetes bacterium]|nr:hypothetical protein [Planctomycetota bacterium]